MLIRVLVGKGDATGVCAGESWPKRKLESRLLPLCAGLKILEACAYEEKKGLRSQTKRTSSLLVSIARNSLGKYWTAREAAVRHV